MHVKNIHPQFHDFVREIERDVADVKGFLSSRDIHFLALVAAHPCSRGEILEIGAYRGKSSVVLAKASALANQAQIISCDPLCCDVPANHPTAIAVRQEFDDNLARKNVTDRVEFHQTFSQELAKTWSRPIRMLWIDGDHRYLGVRQDLVDFRPFLQDGAILVMHDVLNDCDGVGRVFVEDVLESPHYGQAGINGNIAWAQFHKNPADAERFAAHKRKLAAGMRPLLPIQTHANGVELRGWSKLRYRFLRWRAQSPVLTPEHWLKQVA